GDLAELVAGQGMNDPGLVAGGGVGALNRLMIGTGPFDGDRDIAEVMSRDRLPQGGDGLLEALPGMLDLGGFDQDAAVEIGEYPLGAGLGTIDRHDAEVLGCGHLDPGVNRAGWLDDRVVARRAASSPPGRSSHANTS